MAVNLPHGHDEWHDFFTTWGDRLEWLTGWVWAFVLAALLLAAGIFVAYDITGGQP